MNSSQVLQIAHDVSLLRGFSHSEELLPEIARIAQQAPWRHLTTPGGGRMSVAMTNCGAWGWHSDARGYRYVPLDPLSGQSWPAMPVVFRRLASNAALRGGFDDFDPDCCLVNRYAVGASMGTHRDFDELDMRHPIVSVSIGLPAVFVWRGAQRSGQAIPVTLLDGDVLTWGGTARAGFHSVRTLKDGGDLLAEPVRYNLTFRRAR